MKNKASCLFHVLGKLKPKHIKPKKKKLFHCLIHLYILFYLYLLMEVRIYHQIIQHWLNIIFRPVLKFQNSTVIYRSESLQGPEAKAFLPVLLKKKRFSVNQKGNESKKEGKKCHIYNLPLLLGLFSFHWVSDLSARYCQVKWSERHLFSPNP